MRRIRGDEEHVTDILGEIEKVAAFIEGMTPALVQCRREDSVRCHKGH